MSSWGWKNDLLPYGRTAADLELYHGVSSDLHGRLVEYDFSGPCGPFNLELWLTSDPNRMNLARIGLWFLDGDVSEDDLADKNQELDLWTGVITSNFTLNGTAVSIQTVASQDTSAVAFTISSELWRNGTLGVFIDLPWNAGLSFQAPFVGYFKQPSLHKSSFVGKN